MFRFKLLLLLTGVSVCLGTSPSLSKPPLIDETFRRLPKLEYGYTRYTLVLKPRDDEDELTVEIVCGVFWKAGSNPLVYGGEFRRNYFRPLKYFRVTRVTELESNPMWYREKFVPADSLFLPYDSKHEIVIDVPIESSTPLQTWVKVKQTFVDAKWQRAELQAASVIKVSGDDGGDDFLLLHHFDSSVALHAFPDEQ